MNRRAGTGTSTAHVGRRLAVGAAAWLTILALQACGEGPPRSDEAMAEPASTDRPEEAAAVADGTDVDDARAALPEGAEAVSLLGAPLEPPDLDPEVRAGHEENLAAAEADLAEDPEDADALIWQGRRLAYLARYRDAIDVYTRAMELHPDDARLYRHRGHRWITVRELDRAVADLRRAAELIEGTEDEVEPDGLPNARGVPTSTLHFNIWYHLGLAHYLLGDLPAALLAWNECLAVSRHPDSVVATSYWLNNVLRRLDLDARADSVLADLGAAPDIIESTSYLDVLRLWKGERTPDQLRSAAGGESRLAGVTTEYGIGNWHFVQGRRERAYEIWEAILGREDQWAAFGYIAAEAELARLEARTTEGGGEG